MSPTTATVKSATLNHKPETPRPQASPIDNNTTSSSSPVKKPSPDIGSEDLIQLFQKRILPEWENKYGLSKGVTKALDFTAKNYLDDNNHLRIVCALGNEIAVAIDESMKQWGFPKPLAQTLYYGLWAVAVVSCGARAVLRGLGTQNLKPFVESSIQDAVAAIFGPTGIVIIANKIQNAIYKTTKFIPESIVSFIKPIISVALAEVSIPKILDPIGKTIAKHVSNLISNADYEQWSQAISNRLQAWMKPKAQAA